MHPRSLSLHTTIPTDHAPSTTLLSLQLGVHGEPSKLGRHVPELLCGDGVIRVRPGLAGVCLTQQLPAKGAAEGIVQEGEADGGEAPEVALRGVVITGGG